jgi:hypothetical protein
MEKKSRMIPERINNIETMLNHTNIDSIINNVNLENDFTKSDDIRELMPKKYIDLNAAIKQLGGNLLYIKSGSTGHTFKGVYTPEEKKNSYALKVVAYSKKEKYGDMYNIKRPENAELLMIRLLSYFVTNKMTPHIVLPITTFNTSIKPFLSLKDDDIINNKRYDEFLKRYKKGVYYSNVSILISEWANAGDFLDYLRKNYKIFKVKHWKNICFQFLSVLAIIQAKYPSFRHNDLKANNILVHEIPIEPNSEKYKYIINGQTYIVPNIGFQLKIWDFDFATIPGLIDNAKVEAEWTSEININPVKNRYYDVHYFFNTLIRKEFFPQFFNESHIPDKVKEFVQRIVPDKFRQGELVSERGRILINEEYLTPDEILKNDPFFSCMRV